jgi:hypothetical protein
MHVLLRDSLQLVPIEPQLAESPLQQHRAGVAQDERVRLDLADLVFEPGDHLAPGLLHIHPPRINDLENPSQRAPARGNAAS